MPGTDFSISLFTVPIDKGLQQLSPIPCQITVGVMPAVLRKIPVKNSKRERKYMIANNEENIMPKE